MVEVSLGEQRPAPGDVAFGDGVHSVTAHVRGVGR